MDWRKRVWVCVMGLLVHGSAAWAASRPCAADVVSEAMAAGPVVKTTTDPATGAMMTMSRSASGEIGVELKKGDVSIRRAFNGVGSVTTLAARGQRLLFSISGNDLVVTTPTRVFSATILHPETFNDGARYLSQSEVFQAAKSLIDRIVLRPETFEGQAFLLTKGLLGAMSGESAGVQEHQRWAAAAASRAKVVRAGLADGPGDCWDKYVSETTRIVDDGMRCFNGCGGSEFCLYGCGLIYDLRCEMAFMWLVKCSGGFFVG